jgi:endoglucanase
MKTILLIIASFSVANAYQSALFSVEPVQDQQKNIGISDKQYEALDDSIAPDSSGMNTLTSFEFSQKMVPGWNLGNTLEAMPNETSWGNPLTTQRLIDSVSAAGFKSVRIPVAWSRFTDTSTYTIDTTWLKRVDQVVKYAINDSLYVVMNEHWDGGWQQPTYKDSAYVKKRLAAMWKQIAIYFRDYNDHLLFAGLNEVMVTNNYNTPTKEYYTVQNSYEQTFVNTVRSTSGRNYYRYLAVQGFNTNIDYTASYFSVPVDVTPKRLIVEVHYYDPYDFTLNGDDKITQWGMYATNPLKTETWANETWADNEFHKMKVNFVDKGLGVIIGEYGATIRSSLGSAALNTEYESYRRYYMQYITRSIERNQLVPYYWDIGYYGNHGSGIFDRNTGAHVFTDIMEAVIDTSKVSPVMGVLELPATPKRFSLSQNYPNPFNPTTTIKYQLAAGSNVSLKVFDVLGREVETLVNERQTAGEHSVQFNAASLPSGIYFYTLNAGSYQATKKLTLIK